jgi:transcriptional regulator GlxA family with amidase domain
VLRSVVLVAYDRFQLLDLAGPADVFRSATLLGAEPAYELRTVAPSRSVTSESGVRLSADRTLAAEAIDGAPIDTLVVVGGRGVGAFARDGRAVDQVRALAGRSRRITSVCTGAFVLAAAGLLDGHRATTHWSACAALAERFPEIDVEPDRIHVHDRDRWTSAGVTAGIDLALALVEDDHGGDLAHAVAGWLVVFVRRAGGQAQFSAQLAARPARSEPIAELQRWLPDHLGEDLSVAALAERAAMSPRSFARRFREETGTTPAAYVEALRLESARRLLESSTAPVATVAATTGFGRPETLHRAFARRVGTTPDRYRRHFRRN